MLSFAALLLLAPLTYAQSLQVVTVGKGPSLEYGSNTITAAVGSKVEFQFYGPAHSVVQASFDKPCAALSGGHGFFAGTPTTGPDANPKTFTLTINDTQPIWYYCAFPGHCQAGMVGVINPNNANTSETLTIFKANAAKTTNSTTPPQQQGFVVGTFVGASSNSSTSTTGSSTNAPATTTASPTTSGSSSGSTGSVTTSAKPSTTSGNDASQAQKQLALVGGVIVAAAALML